MRLIDLSEERRRRVSDLSDEELDGFLSRAEMLSETGEELRRIFEAASGLVSAIALSRPDATPTALDRIVAKALTTLTMAQGSIVNLWVNPPTPPAKRAKRRRPKATR